MTTKLDVFPGRMHKRKRPHALGMDVVSLFNIFNPMNISMNNMKNIFSKTFGGKPVAQLVFSLINFDYFRSLFGYF